MKFSKQLVYNAVAEWRDHYMDYGDLKKYVSRLGSLRQQLTKSGGGSDPSRDLPLERYTRWGEVSAADGALSTTASPSPSPGPCATPEEQEVAALHAKAALRTTLPLATASHDARRASRTSSLASSLREAPTSLTLRPTAEAPTPAANGKGEDADASSRSRAYPTEHSTKHSLSDDDDDDDDDDSDEDDEAPHRAMEASGEAAAASASDPPEAGNAAADDTSSSKTAAKTATDPTVGSKAANSSSSSALPRALRRKASSNVLFELEHGQPRHAPSDYYSTPAGAGAPRDRSGDSGRPPRPGRPAAGSTASGVASATLSPSLDASPPSGAADMTPPAPTVQYPEETQLSPLPPTGGTPQHLPPPVEHTPLLGASTAAAAVASPSLASRMAQSPGWRSGAAAPSSGQAAASSRSPSPTAPAAEWLAQRRDAFQRLERKFFERLHLEAHKVETFFLAMQRELARITEALAIDAQHARACDDHARLAALRRRYHEHYLEIVELMNFTELNATGFEKILKKHDKVLGVETKAPYLANVLQQLSFYRAAQEQRAG